MAHRLHLVRIEKDRSRREGNTADPRILERYQVKMTTHFVVSVIVMIGTFLQCQIAAANNRCEAMFRTNDGYRQQAAPVSVSVARPTVQIVHVVVESNNDRFFLLRPLSGEDWFSSYSLRGFDPQGDPRWTMDSLGPYLAEVFGFRYTADGDLLVPTPETYNRRISLFNTFLIENRFEPISITFYLQAKPRLRSFVERTSRDLGVPVAAGEGSHTIHDISYHYASVLLPKVFLEMIRTDAEIAFKGLSVQDETVARSMLYTALVIDGFTSFPNLLLDPAKAKKRLIEHLSHAMPASGQTYSVQKWRELAASHSSLDVFLRKILFFHSIIPSNDLSPRDSVAFLYREHGIRNEENIMRFIDELRTKYPELNRSLDEQGLGDVDGLLRLSHERRNELQQAAQKFLQERSTVSPKSTK